MRQQHNNPPQQKHRLLFTTCLTLVLGWGAFSNAAFASRYSFTDKNPLAGINYYRLKIVDSDGQFEFSNGNN